MAIHGDFGYDDPYDNPKYRPRGRNTMRRGGGRRRYADSFDSLNPDSVGSLSASPRYGLRGRGMVRGRGGRGINSHSFSGLSSESLDSLGPGRSSGSGSQRESIVERRDPRGYSPGAMLPRYMPNDYDVRDWSLREPPPGAYPHLQRGQGPHGEEYRDLSGGFDFRNDGDDYSYYHGFDGPDGLNHQQWDGPLDSPAGRYLFYNHARQGEDIGHSVWGVGGEDGEELMAEGEYGGYVWRARGRRW